MLRLSRHTLTAYQLITRLGAPLVFLYLRYRLHRGKEDPVRLPERFGHTSVKRGKGRLVWLHAASIGEAISLLKLLNALRTKLPDAQLLLTTGTVTSARLLASRLPSWVTHQFVPVDTPQAVTRFLNHWQPQLAVFTESELWPNMLLKTRQSGAMMALVNARMSEHSFLYWQNQPEMIGQMLACFSFIAAQTETDAGRFRALCHTHVLQLGNLKYDAEPLDVDNALLGALSDHIRARPCLVASSLHPGEDDLVVDVHAALKQQIPELLTIIIPRHPDRGARMLESAKSVTNHTGRRSIGDFPDQQTDIYIADTIGELGLWYRLATVVIIGGSFVPHGGQNLLEAIRLHVPVVCGPHMYNFSEIATALSAATGMVQVAGKEALTRELYRLLTNKASRDTLVQHADAWLAATPPVAEVVAEKLAGLVGAV